MGFSLAIVSGKGAGQSFAFAQRRVRIGRDGDNDLVLYDTGVSRYHCEVLDEDGTFTLRDVGSANGTLLNERLTTEARLKPGDTIRIGPVAFTFAVDTTARTAPSHEEAFAPSDDTGRRQVEEQQTSLVERAVNAPTVAPKGVSRPGVEWLAAQPKPRLLLLAALVLLSAALAAALLWNHTPKDRSGEIFIANAHNATLRFGSGKIDIYTPDRVNFRFAWKGGRVAVHYSLGGIDEPKELAVLINGTRLTYAPLAPGKWLLGQELAVPRELLRPGSNVLTFDNTLTPQQKKRWGVSQVSIIEKPLPAADPNKAQQLFKLGKAAFDTRSVAPQNLTRAIAYFDEARAYLEALAKPPPLYAEIGKAEKAAQEELQNILDSQLFAAEKALRLNSREEAAHVLRELLRYFPDPDDPRHERVKARLNEVGDSGIE